MKQIVLILLFAILHSLASVSAAKQNVEKYGEECYKYCPPSKPAFPKMMDTLCIKNKRNPTDTCDYCKYLVKSCMEVHECEQPNQVPTLAKDGNCMVCPEKCVHQDNEYHLNEAGIEAAEGLKTCTCKAGGVVDCKPTQELKEIGIDEFCKRQQPQI